MINPAVFYGFYSIALTYLSYRFYLAGKKGSDLGKDFSLFTFFYALKFFVEMIGLGFFYYDPYIAAVVTKIIGFGLWYVALIATSRVFSKVVLPSVEPRTIALVTGVWAVGALVYHAFRLTPLYISNEGIPLWDLDPLVAMAQQGVTATVYLLIGIIMCQQMMKARQYTRAILFGVGCSGIALFASLTYFVETVPLFLLIHTFTILSSVVLMLSVWTNLLRLEELHYFQRNTQSQADGL